MSDIHALSGAYAVDALDDIERAQFERHLADCPACTAEVRSLREAAALLAETTATAPSEGLRDRVLSGISTVRPLPPVVPEEPEPSTVTASEPRRRRRVVTFLVAAAAAVAIGTGGVIWVSDDSPEIPVPRVPTVEAVTGRGLMIVDALASSWGVEPNGSGKTVWFEIDCRASHGVG